MERSHGADMPQVDPEAVRAGEIFRLIDAVIPGAFDGLDDNGHARLEARIVEELRREPELRSEDTTTAPTRERDGLVDPDAAYRLHLPRRDVSNA